MQYFTARDELQKSRWTSFCGEFDQDQDRDVDPSPGSQDQEQELPDRDGQEEPNEFLTQFRGLRSPLGGNASLGSGGRGPTTGQGGAKL